MEEVMENITQDEVLELIGTFPLQPTRGKLIISVNTKDEDDAELGEEPGFDETQYVLATSPSPFDGVKPGCRVLLDLDRMSIKTKNEEGDIVFSINIKPVKVGERLFAIINDSAIDAVDNR